MIFLGIGKGPTKSNSHIRARDFNIMLHTKSSDFLKKYFPSIIIPQSILGWLYEMFFFIQYFRLSFEVWISSHRPAHAHAFVRLVENICQVNCRIATPAREKYQPRWWWGGARSGVGRHLTATAGMGDGHLTVGHGAVTWVSLLGRSHWGTVQSRFFWFYARIITIFV
jgi:hypothetical protein